MRKIRILITILLSVCLLFCFFGCEEEEKEPEQSRTGTARMLKKTALGSAGFYRFSMTGEGDLPAGTYVYMTLSTDDGMSQELTFMLLPEYAPKTVKNFLSYIDSGFYRNTVIHRISTDYSLIQGGGYKHNGSSYSLVSNTRSSITGEFTSNGNTTNYIAHTAGVISMARSSDYDSATSQFFIQYEPYLGWNGSYAAFGFLINQKDIDYVKNVALGTTCNSSEQPTSRILKITSVRYEVKK